MLEKILTILTTLVAAINANTKALGGKGATTAAEKPKTETAAQKKARVKKEKAAAVKAAKDTVTLDGAKKAAAAKAKEQGTKEEQVACMNQIRGIVSEIAEECYSDATKSLQDFDETGLVLFMEQLAEFEYKAETEDDPVDEMEI